MIIPSWLLGAISIAAGVAGVLGFLLSIYIFRTSRLDQRPKLAVDLFPAVFEYEDPVYGPMPPEDMVFLDVSNPGSRRVKVNNKQVEFARGFWFVRRRKRTANYPHFMSTEQEPYWLPPGDGNTYATDSSDFIEWLSHRYTGQVHVRGWIIDATGKRYRSTWARFDIPTS